MSPRELIQRAKLRYMKKDVENVNWEDQENDLLAQWYYVSKIMSYIIPGSFPYFTFQGLSNEIMKDPNFKNKEEK